MTKLVLSILLVVVAVAAATLGLLHYPRAQAWAERAVSPGELSIPHAFLERNCAACHTPLKGVEAKNCIVCHADNQAILQRQPSAFHADVAQCAACHLEHQGRIPRTTVMDHVALARIGLKQLESESPQAAQELAPIKRWLRKESGAPLIQNSGVTVSTATVLRREEALLECATCHKTKDRHMGLLGTNCAQCHGTTKWTIPKFRHPSPVSQSCAQCHQAPPSHYMMHFQMIDQKICGQPNAKVNQCFLCHQTTAWNDIRGVGFYKHH